MPANQPGGQPLRRTLLTDTAVGTIAEILAMDRSRISTTAPFADLGLSSAQLARLTAHLEDVLGVEVPITALYDHPDIEQLVDSLMR
ncbi:acyl carrier protein [Nocardia sp. NPDC059180]|uniref:acyl carrier protein n=1 Tax=Nocardia sp. NPDC059180 TaxID=3346761 RepID=UPI0036A615A5